MAAIVLLVSTKPCGTFAPEKAPCAICTMNALGKLWAWRPCNVRMPSAQ